MKFKKQKIELEVNVPEGFSIDIKRIEQYVLSDLSVITNNMKPISEQVSEVTDVIHDRVVIEMIMQREKHGN